MGYYIDQNSNGMRLPACDKADYLILDGVVEIPKPDKWVPNLVCVLHNGIFDAAGYVYDENEFRAFADPRDYRPKTWLLYEHAAKLSGYKS